MTLSAPTASLTTRLDGRRYTPRRPSPLRLSIARRLTHPTAMLTAITHKTDATTTPATTTPMTSTLLMDPPVIPYPASENEPDPVG
jgi:hypothetical protein